MKFFKALERANLDTEILLRVCWRSTLRLSRKFIINDNKIDMKTLHSSSEDMFVFKRLENPTGMNTGWYYCNKQVTRTWRLHRSNLCENLIIRLGLKSENWKSWKKGKLWRECDDFWTLAKTGKSRSKTQKNAWKLP